MMALERRDILERERDHLQVLRRALGSSSPPALHNKFFDLKRRIEELDEKDA